MLLPVLVTLHPNHTLTWANCQADPHLLSSSGFLFMAGSPRIQVASMSRCAALDAKGTQVAIWSPLLGRWTEVAVAADVQPAQLIDLPFQGHEAIRKGS